MKRIAKGVYKDAYRLDARATANRMTRFKSFPFDTPLKTIKNWQESERATIRRTRPGGAHGTFDADVVTYMAKPEVQALNSHEARKQRLEWWAARFAGKRRMSITVQDVQDGLDALVAAHMKPGTIQHYRMALIDLWTKLDGRQAWCPAKETSRPKSDRRIIRAIPEPALDALLGMLPETPTPLSASLRVLAQTGLPPGILAVLKPSDIDLDHGTVIVPPRHKGAGVDGRILPLTDAGKAAFKDWLAAGGTTPPIDALRYAFKGYAKAAGVPTARLYDLRHSFLTRCLVATNGNLEAVQALALHASKSTTEFYTRGAVAQILWSAVEQINGGNLAENSSSRTLPAQIH
jgi:integrase